MLITVLTDGDFNLSWYSRKILSLSSHISSIIGHSYDNNFFLTFSIYSVLTTTAFNFNYALSILRINSTSIISISLFSLNAKTKKINPAKTARKIYRKTGKLRPSPFSFTEVSRSRAWWLWLESRKSVCWFFHLHVRRVEWSVSCEWHYCDV